MALVGLLGFAAFTLVSFAVGFRLLWLGHRTGGVPELAIGGSFVLGGGVAGVLGVVVPAFAGLESAATAPSLLISSLALQLGVSLLGYFTWYVFRRGESWAAALLGVCVAGLTLSFLGQLATSDFDPRQSGPFEWAGLFFRVVVYAWGLTESTREYVAAKRRCAIGLADPLVANRFLLWAVGLGAILAVWLYSAMQMATGRTAGFDFVVIALLGFTCAGALWLAFFPPDSYRRRFAAAAGA